MNNNPDNVHICSPLWEDELKHQQIILLIFVLLFLKIINYYSFLQSMIRHPTSCWVSWVLRTFIMTVLSQLNLFKAHRELIQIIFLKLVFYFIYLFLSISHLISQSIYLRSFSGHHSFCDHHSFSSVNKVPYPASLHVLPGCGDSSEG